MTHPAILASPAFGWLSSSKLSMKLSIGQTSVCFSLACFHHAPILFPPVCMALLLKRNSCSNWLVHYHHCNQRCDVRISGSPLNTGLEQTNSHCGKSAYQATSVPFLSFSSPYQVYIPTQLGSRRAESTYCWCFGDLHKLFRRHREEDSNSNDMYWILFLSSVKPAWSCASSVRSTPGRRFCIEVCDATFSHGCL